MNRFVCAAVLMTVLPGMTGTGAVPLVAPLERSVDGYTSFFSYAPKLNLDFSKVNQPLQDALRALDRAEPPPSLDEIDLVVSALKSANEDRALQPYLEFQLGYSIEQTRGWIRQNVAPTFVQRGFKRGADAVDKVVRTTVGLGVLGLGAGTGLLAIPLAFTGVGLIPAVALFGVSTQILAAGAAVLTKPENASVIEKAMPDLMVAMLGPAQAMPDARVDWKRQSFAPTEELLKRLHHAMLLQKAVEGLGTTELGRLSATETAISDTAQALYARDLVFVEMLLAVMSRQLDGGRHLDFAANLLAALPTAKLTPLVIAARALGDAPDAFLGIPSYVEDKLRDGRRREVTHFARWVEAALLARAAAGDVDGPDLLRKTEDLLGDDAEPTRFDDARAKTTLENARRGLPVEPTPTTRRERFVKMLKTWKK